MAACWQCKALSPRHRVGELVVKELQSTVRDFGASKGIIATTTYLTRGALARVLRNEFTLGKCDHDDLMRWIERHLRGS